MPGVAIVCWPDCPAQTVMDIRTGLHDASRKEYSIEATEDTIDAVLMQVHAEELVEHHANKREFPLNRVRGTCTCLSASSFNSKLAKFAKDAGCSVFTDPARVHRLTTFFDRPLLAKQKITPFSVELLGDLLRLQAVMKDVATTDYVLWIDASMAAYGLRRRRKGKDALAGILFRKIKNKPNFVHASKYPPASILRAYHNLDLLSVGSNAKETAFFLGMRFLAPQVAFKYARALCTIPPDAEVSLLDAAVLKVLTSSDDRVDLQFVDEGDGAVARSQLVYSGEASALLAAYREKTRAIAASICTTRVDSRFSIVWTASEAEADALTKSHADIVAALRGVPVFPEQYGKVSCSGGKEFGVASEGGFDATLVAWIVASKPSRAQVCGVLRDVVSAVVALAVAKKRHSNLSARNVAVKTSGKQFVVRLLGPQHISPRSKNDLLLEALGADLAAIFKKAPVFKRVFADMRKAKTYAHTRAILKQLAALGEA
jgi:hypothetical protein